MTWQIVALFVAIAGIPYLWWSWRERRRHGHAARVLDDVASLGDDAVPGSIHPQIDLDLCIGSGACTRACPEKDVIGIVNGRAALVNPLACIGHGACAAACPVGAITLVFGTAERGLELPKVDEMFQTNHAGIYIAGELGGMGLIRNAVEQGRQAAEAAVSTRPRGRAGDLDAIVVGAGPAGISAALTLIGHQRKVLILEQGEFGGTIAHYPRNKVVMTNGFDLPGYGRVRRRTMTKEELVALWTDIRERTQLPVREGVKVDLIAADDGNWRVCAEAWSERAPSVILALGRRGAPRKLDVPGEELPKVHYRLLEPEPFAGKHVLVVGGGNSAADCVLALVASKGCASVGLSYRRAELARMRSSVREQLEAAIARGDVIPHLGTQVTRITATEVTLKSATGTKALRNDDVIVQIGGTSPRDLLHTIGIELVEKRAEA